MPIVYTLQLSDSGFQSKKVAFKKRDMQSKNMLPLVAESVKAQPLGHCGHPARPAGTITTSYCGYLKMKYMHRPVTTKESA